MYSRIRGVVLLAAALGAAIVWLRSGEATETPKQEGVVETAAESVPGATAAASKLSLRAPSQKVSKLEADPAQGEAAAAEPLASLDPLRRPIIQAIRATGQSPAQKREAMLSAIRSSGASDEPWTDEARSTFRAWRGAMPSVLEQGIDVGSPSCFRAGCVAEVRFKDEQAYREAARAFRSLSEPHTEHGGRVQTPLAHDKGTLVANWIMLRPEQPVDDEDGV